jgi:hypothetical protein
MGVKRYSDLTKYPNIYKNCYWGNFNVEADRPESWGLTYIEKLTSAHAVFVQKLNRIKLEK